MDRDMDDLLVFVMRLEDRPSLERAFQVVSEESGIESSLTEPEDLRIRFVASKKIGMKVLERVYERGGLVGSNRFRLSPQPHE